MLAKHALYQLNYVPYGENEWDLNPGYSIVVFVRMGGPSHAFLFRLEPHVLRFAPTYNLRNLLTMLTRKSNV